MSDKTKVYLDKFTDTLLARLTKEREAGSSDEDIRTIVMFSMLSFASVAVTTPELAETCREFIRTNAVTK